MQLGLKVRNVLLTWRTAARVKIFVICASAARLALFFFLPDQERNVYQTVSVSF